MAVRVLHIRSFWPLFGVVALAGCSSSLPPVPIPELNPEAGQAAIRQYDSDGDQAIGGDELRKVPALRVALARLDKNKNKKISAEEIDQRLEVWKRARVGMMTCTVVVRLQGRPLDNAQVKLIPESFLGEQIKPVEGTTNLRGMVPLHAAEADCDGAHLAFYRVEISKIVDGKETIAARYNSQSELGMELAPDLLDSFNPTFDLQEP